LEIYHGNSRAVGEEDRGSRIEGSRGGRRDSRSRPSSILHRPSSSRGADIGTYAGAALLLDLKAPARVMGRSGPFFVPETEFECKGYAPNVVFPTGIVQRNGRLLLYYGAADTATAVAEFSVADILATVD